MNLPRSFFYPSVITVLFYIWKPKFPLLKSILYLSFQYFLRKKAFPFTADFRGKSEGFNTSLYSRLVNILTATDIVNFNQAVNIPAV